MPITIDKEWAVVEDDEIVMKAESKELLLKDLRGKGENPNDYEIVAIPKSHGSMYI